MLYGIGEMGPLRFGENLLLDDTARHPAHLVFSAHLPIWTLVSRSPGTPSGARDSQSLHLKV